MMLLRRVNLPFRTLLNKNLRSFGQAIPQHSYEEQTKKTKHNPTGLKDLRGYEHLEQVKQSERNFTNFHSTQVSRTSAYFAFSFLPNAVAAFLGTFTAPPQVQVASDSLVLPKIYPEGVPVYDSIHKTSSSVISSKFLSIINPVAIVCFTPEPLLAVFGYGLGLFVYHTFRRKYAKDILLKLQLLPHTEEIVYQKVNFLGNVTTSRAKLCDLEYYNFSQSGEDETYSARALRGYINRDVSFKIKGTEELLFFDKNGIWHEEGINHSLLV